MYIHDYAYMVKADLERESRKKAAMSFSERIVVFGATGGVGSQVVRQALSMEHHVVAIVRARSPFTMSHPGLEMIRVAGLEDPARLAPALEGAAAAISAIGPRGRKEGPVVSTATSAILAAMEAAGVRRLVVVSAVPVGRVPPGESVINRAVLLPVIRWLLRDLYADLAAMEQLVQQSEAEWTIIRPPRLINRPLTGIYRSKIGGNVPRGYSISRANVAHAILAALDDPQTIRQLLGVAK